MEEKVNILIVEDDSIQNIFAHSLPGKGIEFDLKLSSYEECFDKLSQQKFSVVIAPGDVPQPLDFLHGVLRTTGDQSAVIFIVDGENDELTQKLLRNGAWACIPRGRLNGESLFNEIINAHQVIKMRKEGFSLKQSYIRQMEAMVESMLEGVIMVDKYSNVVVINPAGKRFLELLGKTPLTSPLEIKEINELFDFIIKGEECGVKEMELPEKNVFLRLEATPVKEEKELIGVVILIRDVTTEKKVDKMKNDFISVVSHELRTPLTTMKEFISILLDEIPGKINSEQKEYLQIVKSNIDRLARIINEILDIAKIESGKMRIERELVDVVEIARGVVKTFKPMAEERGLYLELSAPDKPLTTYGDRDRLAQIFTNLIHNAIKFTPRGGVRVILTDTEREITAQVIDTGIGISKENMSKLFMKFQQFNADFHLKEPGTGLGLSITKHLVELHKGKIWAESEYGKGSRFVFTLPKYTHQQALLELCAENLHNCIMLNKSFSLLYIEIPDIKFLEKHLGKEKIEGLRKNLDIIFKKVLRRNEDLVFKGKDSFAILLNMTPKENALVVKGRIVQALHDFRREFERPEMLKIRIGVAGYPEDGSREEELLDKARANAENIFPEVK
jgi:diguanylate cyclase (GGDEF)-like protein/PAS domain S-box-containing protein